jgi:hypothetical protein
MSGIQDIIARETTTDRDRERGRLNQHSDVVNRECWLRPTGARRPIALDYVDQVEVLTDDGELARLGHPVAEAHLLEEFDAEEVRR